MSDLVKRLREAIESDAVTGYAAMRRSLLREALERIEILEAADYTALREFDPDAWLARKLQDPKWVKKMKARSDEADRQMRERGLLT